MGLDFLKSGGLFTGEEQSYYDNRPGYVVPDDDASLRSTFDVGSTIDTFSSPASMSQSIPTQTELSGDYIGTLVHIEIKNRSGATDLYDYQLTNDTKSITIQSESNVSIVNGGQYGEGVFISADIHDIGDIIKFRISNGVIGTAAGQTLFGHVGLRVKNYVKIHGDGTNPILFGKTQV